MMHQLGLWHCMMLLCMCNVLKLLSQYAHWLLFYGLGATRLAQARLLLGLCESQSTRPNTELVANLVIVTKHLLHPVCISLDCHSLIFCSILFYSVLFYSVLFCSILFCSILFCSILFYSILFCSILFCSILF